MESEFTFFGDNFGKESDFAELRQIFQVPAQIL